MNNDPLRIFEPGFSGDSADTRAREVIDAWRDEWHLEPEPEMDNGNFKIYESLVKHVAGALRAAATTPPAVTPHSFEGSSKSVPCERCGLIYSASVHHTAVTEAGEQEREHLAEVEDAADATAEIDRLTRWQDLCFALLSEIRQWIAPGSIKDTDAPRVLRAMLSERAELRQAAANSPAAPPSTSEAIRAAAEELKRPPSKQFSVRFLDHIQGSNCAEWECGNCQQRFISAGNLDCPHCHSNEAGSHVTEADAIYNQAVDDTVAILSRWFGKGETESNEANK